MEKVQRRYLRVTTGVGTTLGDMKVSDEGFALTEFRSQCGKQVSGQTSKLIPYVDKCY